MKAPTDVLAVIPARGGSKRLPGKNLTPLAGLPLVAHTIRLAKSCPRIDRCVVSTDSDAIAQIAKAYGAEAPFLRPPELAQDDVPAIQPVLHAVRWLESHEGYRPECVMLLQPTSPLRTVEDIEAAIRLAEQRQADAVVSVCPTHSPTWLRRVAEDGRLLDGASGAQDTDAAHRVNGAIYVARREVLLQRQNWYTDRTYAYVMPPERSLDIDTAWDLYLANLILSEQGSHEAH